MAAAMVERLVKKPGAKLVKSVTVVVSPSTAGLLLYLTDSL
jgi:hypothetical protein